MSDDKTTNAPREPIQTLDILSLSLSTINDITKVDREPPEGSRLAKIRSKLSEMNRLQSDGANDIEPIIIRKGLPEAAKAEGGHTKDSKGIHLQSQFPKQEINDVDQTGPPSNSPISAFENKDAGSDAHKATSQVVSKCTKTDGGLTEDTHAAHTESIISKKQGHGAALEQSTETSRASTKTTDDNVRAASANQDRFHSLKMNLPIRSIPK